MRKVPRTPKVTVSQPFEVERWLSPFWKLETWGYQPREFKGKYDFDLCPPPSLKRIGGSKVKMGTTYVQQRTTLFFHSKVMAYEKYRDLTIRKKMLIFSIEKYYSYSCLEGSTSAISTIGKNISN